MEKIILNTQLREGTGKATVKKLRQQGTVPAVVYKQGHKTISVQVKTAELIHILHTSAGENAIITLKLDPPEKDKTVIIKAMQLHPIMDVILHVDFQEISLTEKIKVNVPIVLKGEAIGTKSDGGILEHIIRELVIECLPTQIPGKIEVNVEALKINDSIHVRDLQIPPEIKVLTDPEQAVVSVSPPKAEEEVAPAAEAAVGEEAQGPEVISEKEAEERKAKKVAAEAETKEKEKQEHKEEQKGK